jgi:hypothetical protein
MTDTNKALEALDKLEQNIKELICEIIADTTAYERSSHKMAINTIRAALSPDAVVIPREEFEEIKHSMNRAIDMIWREQPNLSVSHIKQALAILSQYGEQK